MQEKTLLMIPGPIELDPGVLRAMSLPTLSHVSPEFAQIFGEVLENVRRVFLSESGQPFVLAGSGTLAMDMAAVNFVERGDKALVVNTGYFGDRMAEILQRYGAEVTQVRAELGQIPPLEEVERLLSSDSYKLLAVTHVDTSTGLACDVKGLAELAARYGALSVVDGVCATAGQEMRQEEWGVDISYTASQKAISTPPGLALLVASQKAMEILAERKSLIAGYYTDLNKWLPIMQIYEERRPAYFATPPVNLIYGLRESLRQMLAEGMDACFRRHRIIGEAFQASMRAMGLKMVPHRADDMASTMTAIYYPEHIGASLLGKVKANGVVLAGGLHPAIADRYFRVGHMGPVGPGEILTTIAAIEKGLVSSGYKLEAGLGLAVAQRRLLEL